MYVLLCRIYCVSLTLLNKDISIQNKINTEMICLLYKGRCKEQMMVQHMNESVRYCHCVYKS